MKSIYSKEEQAVLGDILGRLHVARCIALNQAHILDCLDDLESLHQAMYNDHNGEYNDADLLRQRRRFVERYKEKHDHRLR